VGDKSPWRFPAAALAAVALAALAAVGTGCSARTTAPALVAPADLTSILLSADQINSLMGASAMAPGAIGEAMVTPAFTLSDPDCSATLTVAEDPVYAGSGFTAVRVQRLQEPGDHREHLVGQAAVTFPSADQAGAFVKSSAAKWKNCTGQTVTQTGPDKTVRWIVGTFTGSGARIVQPHTQADDRWHCQHVLSAASNVVLDVDACGYHVAGEGVQIADTIAANATK
jgi:serine/threonine kinase PknH